MFKRVLTKIFKSKDAPVKPSGSAPAPFASTVKPAEKTGRTSPESGTAAPAARTPLPKPQAGKAEAASEKPTSGKPADNSAEKVKQAWKAKAEKSLSKEATPEEMCGITPGMKREEIQKIVSHLYRRHNRAASSLDAKLRTEAELMLESISAVKEKYLG